MFNNLTIQFKILYIKILEGLVDLVNLASLSVMELLHLQARASCVLLLIIIGHLVANECTKD